MDRQQAIGNRDKATGKRQQAIALAISIAAWGTSSNKRHTNASRGQASNLHKHYHPHVGWGSFCPITYHM